MKKLFKKLMKYPSIFLLMLVLGLTNGLSNLLSGVGLNQVAQVVRVKPAYAATLEYVGGAEASGANVDYAVSLTALTGGSGSAAAANDLVIVATGFTGTANGDPRVTTAGYTEEVGGVDLWANDTNDANFSVNWKIMGGTPDTSVTCGGSAGATIGAVCVVQVWRNVDTSNPMDVTATTATGTNSTLFNSASITPVTSGAVVISAGLAGMAAVDTSITAPTGYGNQVDISADPGTAATVGISSKAWSGSGAEDPAAWTNITTTTADGWAAYTLAIRPGNDPPTITVDNPPAGNTNVAEGSSYNIQYDLADADSTATVDFYYETDGDGAGGTAIAACQNQAEGTNATCSFSTSILSVSTAYYIYGIADDTVNPTVTDVSSGTITVNDAPTLSISQPPSGNTAVAEGSSYNVTYTLDDTDNVVTAAFYYDTDSDGVGGTAISGACATAAEGTNVTCSFNTSVLTPGTAYYIYGTTNDGVNASVTGVSAGTITVNDAPTLSISQPDGVGDTVNLGDPYNITYDLADTDSVVTVDFYYDSDASGLDGTAITGCVNQVEGTGVTCSWDTTGVTPGTYYVYGRDVNDSVNAEVSDYSPGQITINASTVVTVDEIGTQTSPLLIPSTGNYIGGAFTMLRGTGSANVTSITITESGTVDAQANLDNIKLQYDLDTAAPYDCASVSYDAGDTQYGATDTDGFSAANGTSVFTGSVAVSDVQAMCVYVVMDVGSGASDGQTMITRITNPSTDVAVSVGTVEPSTAQGAGTTSLETPKITVATEGTQANMIIGTGDNNVGGAFSFTRNTASADVTSIIITDTGTVNANANISDVRVYYKQEVTCSTSIPVDATQFNSTPGAFDGSEKATVTGTMSVGTSKICVYVKVDVGDGASDAQTLEIQIADPSTEVTASAGTVTPASAVSISDTTTLNLPTYTSQGIPFLYTANNWGTGGSGVSFYLEVYMRQTTGTAYARLLNETDSTAVSGSTLSTASASFTRLRTAALTLTDGKTYRVQFGKIGADAGETLGGKLVVNQNGGGGADLAEYYTSTDQLDLAEVVAIDGSHVAGVRRSDQPYQKDVLGVVATQPGIILGENIGQSYPIALVGRVPVNVTTENGMPKTGDRVTASSTAGYAMRATQAGRVLGTIIQDVNPENFAQCPVETGASASTLCSQVLVFVNLTDYSGMPVELVMSQKEEDEAKNTGLESAADTEALTGATVSVSVANQTSTREEKILAFLKTVRDERLKSQTASSEVFTDRVSASTEIITPTLFADQIFAKSIKADSIEGLQIWTDQISSLSEKYAGLETSTSVADTSEANTQVATEQKALAIAMKNLATDTITVQMDGSILGKLSVAGALHIGGDAEFAGKTIFAKLATFLSDVIFKGKVMFEKAPTFGSDTAGFAVIAEGQQSVDVVFDEAYTKQPIVSVSITSDASPLLLGADKDLKNDIREVEADFAAAYFDGDIKYIVTKKSEQGFTIVLNRGAPRELQFSWVAIAVSDAKISYSKEDASLGDISVDETSEEVVLAEEPAATPGETAPITPPAEAVAEPLAADALPIESTLLSASDTLPIADQESIPIVETPSQDISPVIDDLTQLTSILGQ